MRKYFGVRRKPAKAYGKSHPPTPAPSLTQASFQCPCRAAYIMRAAKRINSGRLCHVQHMHRAGDLHYQRVGDFIKGAEDQ